jgi:hypothetical protein
VTRAFRLLLMISVFLCGLHAAEPVQAHDESVHHDLTAGSDTGSGEDSHSGAEKAAHAAHHHCPMAPDQAAAEADATSGRDGMAHFARSAAALNSRSQAPPLEPPAA